MNYAKYVNVFYGNGEIDLPTPQGIAKTWYPIKALCGNTHPHAVYPFGQMSAGTYSSGYSSGYGTHKPNSCKPPEKFLDKNKFGGFSHYHCSGTGAVGLYYNYAIVAPLKTTIAKTFELQNIACEYANPGYYKVKLEDNTTCEVTVDEHTAYHKYSTSSVAIDFSNDGLNKSFGEKFYAYSEENHLEILSPNEICASVKMQGVTLYFYVKALGTISSTLWIENEEFLQSCNFDKTEKPFGAILRSDADNIELQLTFSLISFEHAKEISGKCKTFENCREYTKSAWDNQLSRFEIQASEEEKGLFYSNLYHTLIKPSDFTGHSTLFNQNYPYVLGFETLWDQYKTQLPLIFSVYSEISNKIISSYISLGKVLGMLPHTLALSSNYALEAVQASALPQHLFVDAYLRGVEIKSMEDFFNVTYTDLVRLEKKLFAETSNSLSSTHYLDFSEAITALKQIAKKENRMDYHKKFAELERDISVIYDEKTGLLKDTFTYYEGNHWNYSFRLMADMKKRIELAGGAENFEHLLDTFFDYQKPEDTSSRFEGFNNETDMETPYAYHYLARHDKLAEILSLANDFKFKNTVGGIPGNNDTGGLSSLFICNNIGFFPVTGQDVLLITKPLYKTIKIKLANSNELLIKTTGEGKIPIAVYHNKNQLNDFTISVTDFMTGGEIIIIT